MTTPVPLTARDVQHLDALYDAAVQGSDRISGSLLEGLQAAGRLEHTIVIFAADHGEELYQHNRYLYHSCSVYQTTLHVPLGIAAPGLIPAGARVPQIVELIDVLPTLLDLVGVAAPAEQHGRSLVPYLERPGAAGRGLPAFSEYGSSTIHTVLQDHWKLVHNPDGFSPICIPNAPPNHYPIAKEELYDLSRDPGETGEPGGEGAGEGRRARPAPRPPLRRPEEPGARPEGPGRAEEGAELARLRGALSPLVDNVRARTYH